MLVLRIVFTLFILCSSTQIFGQEVNQQLVEKAIEGRVYLHSSQFNGDLVSFWKEYGNAIFYLADFPDWDGDRELKESRFNTHIRGARKLLREINTEHLEAFLTGLDRLNASSEKISEFFTVWLTIPGHREQLLKLGLSMKVEHLQPNRNLINFIHFGFSSKLFKEHIDQIVEAWSNIILLEFKSPQQLSPKVFRKQIALQSEILQFLGWGLDGEFRIRMMKHLVSEGQLISRFLETLSLTVKYKTDPIPVDEYISAFERVLYHAKIHPFNLLPRVLDIARKHPQPADILLHFLNGAMNHTPTRSLLRLRPLIEETFEAALKNCNKVQYLRLVETYKYLAKAGVVGDHDTISKLLEVAKFLSDKERFSVYLDLDFTSCELGK